jgi:hypothetical protein
MSRSMNEVVEALNNPTLLNEWVAFSNNLQELNNSILYIEGEKCMIFPKGEARGLQSTEGKMSILSRSIYTIFFTVGSRNSTKISNFKNKKIMTNELSSFDEFNGISSCLDNTIRFLSQQSKKMKTPIRFLSQLSKK